jgi:hypothetical protein
MSRIISPHGPTQILILFEEETGSCACKILDSQGREKMLPVFQVVAVFAQLITQFLSDGAKRGLFGPPVGESAGENTGETPSKPNGGA